MAYLTYRLIGQSSFGPVTPASQVRNESTEEGAVSPSRALRVNLTVEMTSDTINLR